MAVDPHDHVTLVDNAGNTLDPGTPFRPIVVAGSLGKHTVAITAGPTATVTPVQLPIGPATSVRVRNAAASASPITFFLSTLTTNPAVIATPYAVDGTGGAPGHITLDPGAVETFGLTAPQIAAVAAGVLYASVITPASGSGVLYITLGDGV